MLFLFQAADGDAIGAGRNGVANAYSHAYQSGVGL